MKDKNLRFLKLNLMKLKLIYGVQCKRLLPGLRRQSPFWNSVPTRYIMMMMMILFFFSLNTESLKAILVQNQME